MTPREELIEIINRPGVVHHFMAQADVERLADAILAAGYRKVEAGPDARETARKLLIEIGHCGIFEGHKGREFLVNDEHIAHIVTAITAAVEAQRERDARIVAAAIEMAEACKRAVPSESAADAEVTRYENARHRLQTVCAAAIREG